MVGFLASIQQATAWFLMGRNDTRHFFEEFLNWLLIRH